MNDIAEHKWMDCSYYRPPHWVVVLTRAKNLNGQYIYKRLQQVFNRWETECGAHFVPLYEPTHWLKTWKEPNEHAKPN